MHCVRSAENMVLTTKYNKEIGGKYREGAISKHVDMASFTLFMKKKQKQLCVRSVDHLTFERLREVYEVSQVRMGHLIDEAVAIWWEQLPEVGDNDPIRSGDDFS